MSTKTGGYFDRYLITAIATEMAVVFVALIAFGVAAAVWNQTHDEISNAIMGLALLSWLSVLGVTVVQLIVGCMCAAVWVLVDIVGGACRSAIKCS